MKRFFLLPVLLILGMVLYGKPVLPEILSDGMVLQQNSKVNIWGKAGPGKTVEVKPCWSKTAVRATVDNEGNWLAVIETPEASFNPRTITISDGEEIVLKDILIGEVWLASGQSNMEMPLQGFNNNPILGANETIAFSGQYPAIRFVTIPKTPSFEPLESVEGRWQVCNPANSPGFSATAFFFAETLHRSLNVPVGIIVSSWGGTKVEGWTSREILETYPDVDLNEEAVNKLHPMARPLLMYNGMIHPLTHYIVKGFIWYQGESNVGAHQVYAERLYNMVTLWRKQWNNPELPFYYVEIAPYAYGNGDDSSAAYLREAQFKAQKLIPHSGMISTNDLVEPYELTNIHPRNKTDVGKRLAFMALNQTYGYDRVVARGPEYNSMEIRDGKVILSFDHAREGFNRTDGIEGFEIAAEDGQFLPAVAVVRDGKVEVFREGVDKPVAVRYCFRNFQTGNFAGTRELPVVPFRTDSFEK
ncbi:sialate O-acetylesterase [Proteiniphilum sp.]|uniref:sialate O-acetylesterase n=1 Tax=Proteiniphilum sp. TaxID=1926877 RepID=UPI003321C030